MRDGRRSPRLKEIYGLHSPPSFANNFGLAFPLAYEKYSSAFLTSQWNVGGRVKGTKRGRGEKSLSKASSEIVCNLTGLAGGSRSERSEPQPTCARLRSRARDSAPENGSQSSRRQQRILKAIISHVPRRDGEDDIKPS